MESKSEYTAYTWEKGFSLQNIIIDPFSFSLAFLPRIINFVISIHRMLTCLNSVDC